MPIRITSTLRESAQMIANGYHLANATVYIDEDPAQPPLLHLDFVSRMSVQDHRVQLLAVAMTPGKEKEELSELRALVAENATKWMTDLHDDLTIIESDVNDARSR